MRHLTPLGILATTLLATAPALAVLPPEGVPLRQLREPSPAAVAAPWEEPQQPTFVSSPPTEWAAEAWSNFSAAHGEDWRVHFDAATGNPRQIYGPGIALGAGAWAARETLLDLVEEHPGLLGPGVLPTDFELVVDTELDGLRYVDFQQTYNGVPVVGGRIHARARAGRIPYFGIETVHGLSLSTRAEVGAQHALHLATADVQRPELLAGPKLVVLPGDARHPRADRLAWEVEVRDQGARLWERRYIDAVDGRSLWREDLIRWASGSITAVHDERTIGDPLIESPMPHLDVSSALGAQVRTDSFGLYDTQDGASEIDLLVQGRNVEVRNHGGPDAAVTTPAGDYTWTATSGFEQAELDVYIFADRARVYARQLSPGVSWLASGSIEANVNIDDACNAYFDGNINFFRAGGPCNNTGRIADVVYHEFGHGYHAFSILTGSYDRAAGEGFADYLACTMTNDPNMGPGFFTSGSALRTCSNDARWPEDVSQDFHRTGTILSGALWDLRESLIGKYGYDSGVAEADRLYARILRSTTDIPSAWLETLVADDDDGSLSNGTPNLCEINVAFANHGLGPEGGPGGLSFDHTPLGNQSAAAETYRVRARLRVDYPECARIEPESVTVHWRGRGAERSLEANLDGTLVVARIPSALPGTTVRYRFEVHDRNGGDSRVFPDPDGTEPAYQFRVGPVQTIWCDDFESGPGEWSHALDAGENREGADDWQLGRPNGRSGDPVEAYSGDHVWGNDLGHDEFNGAYQGNKRNHLRSPRIDTLGHHQVHLMYRRWLNVEDGLFDQATIYVNGVEVWQNEATDGGETHHEDRHWFFHDVDISAVADNRRSVRIKFELDTDQGVQMGGWTIDDVCLVSVAMPEETGAGCSCEGPESNVAGSQPTPLVLALSAFLLAFGRRRP
jgi:hypothetical protein